MGALGETSGREGVQNRQQKDGGRDGVERLDAYTLEQYLCERLAARVRVGGQRSWNRVAQREDGHYAHPIAD